MIECVTSIISNNSSNTIGTNTFLERPPIIPIDFLWERDNQIDEGVVETIIDYMKSLKPESIRQIEPTDDSHLRNHGDTLSPDEQRHIMKYVIGGLYIGHTSGSAPLNNHLLDHAKANKAPPNFVYPGGEIFNFRTFDSAIHRNGLPGDMTVYSGVSFHPKEFMKGDKVLHNPGYTSTSLDPVSAIMYSKNINNNHHVLRIQLPKDSPGLYLGNDKRLTNKGVDKEYILPRNSLFKINPFPKVIDHIDGRKVHLWDAELVS